MPPGSLRAAGAHREVLNLCANNYLGLSSHPDAVMAAAHEALRHAMATA
jgi:glycine C-acetyltransferase